MIIFDAHFHIIDFDFPIKENQGYMPPSYVEEDYQTEVKDLNVSGGAIVSGSLQGFYQGYVLKSLEQLGQSYRGVTQVPSTITDEDIIELNNKCVEALSFNIKRGGSEDIAKLEYFAR